MAASEPRGCCFGSPAWPVILGRAIAARAVPGDTPTKRKDKKKKRSESSRAVKQGAQSQADIEIEDDDVDAVDLASDTENDPWSAPQLPLRKKPAKGGKAGAGAKKPD